MKEFNGTPGPWKYTVRNVNEMMTTFHGVAVGDTYIEVATRNEQEDAQLISAAPCLLSALQDLVEKYDSEDGKQWTTSSKKEAIAKARAAIDKALGE